METKKLSELSHFADDYKKKIKEYDDKMKNSYKVNRVHIPE
jgi:hypothetical protein